jgi:hypothetical protein
MTHITLVDVFQSDAIGKHVYAAAVDESLARIIHEAPVDAL